MFSARNSQLLLIAVGLVFLSEASKEHKCNDFHVSNDSQNEYNLVPSTQTTCELQAYECHEQYVKDFRSYCVGEMS